MPTQIESTVLPFMSLRITIGILVTGSIIKPRIFISTSIRPSYFSLHHIHQTLTDERIRARTRHQHRQVLAQERWRSLRVREIQYTVLRGPPDPLAERFVAPFHQNLLNPADEL